MSNMNLSDEDLSQIEQRLLAVSSGSWFVSLKHSETYYRPNPTVKRTFEDADGHPQTRSVATVGNGNASDPKDPRWIQQARDAEFIAHAKNDIARLLAEVRRLRASKDRNE